MSSLVIYIGKLNMYIMVECADTAPYSEYYLQPE